MKTSYIQFGHFPIWNKRWHFASQVSTAEPFYDFTNQISPSVLNVDFLQIKRGLQSSKLKYYKSPGACCSSKTNYSNWSNSLVDKTLFFFLLSWCTLLDTAGRPKICNSSCSCIGVQKTDDWRILIEVNETTTFLGLASDDRHIASMGKALTEFQEAKSFLALLERHEYS